ncbi:MAG TPA: DUF3455 domain-containing protein [Ferruginibacter sp.]|nr:DUF3455 domain-containing protein [Ferruginibacter sp.]
MHKVKIINPKLFLKALLFATVLTSCKKNKDVEVNTPAYHIAESENLIIPAAVGLPVDQPGGFTRVATYYAEGVQKYKAQAKAGSNPVTYEWVFVAPQATLYDANNKAVGTHGAGPFWQVSAHDSVFAQHYSPAKTLPSPNGSIDWLMLMPKAGKTATGIFANVSYIQRIATVGGKAPSVLPTNDSETAEVKYTAIYRFTQKN